MRNAWLAILAISLVLAFGCVQKPEQPVVQEPVAPAVQPPAPIAEEACSSGNIVQKDDCFLAVAKAKSDPQACRSIYSIEKVDLCYANFAGDDLEVCKMIRDAGMKNSCLAANAVREKSEQICNLIDNADARAACLKQVLPACQLILDPAGRQLCLALEKKDYTLCQTDSCFVLYAVNQSEEGACGLIKSEPDRYYCIAAVKKDADECMAAAQASLRDACIEKAAKELNDLSACGLATPGSDYANRCYLYFAVKDLKMDYCSKPFQEEQRDQCYSDYATQAANTSSCPRIINSLNRIACYYFASAANRMPSLCNPLTNDAQRTDCYAKGIVPDAGPLPSDCANVYSDEWRNKCYYKVARLTYDREICKLITPGPDRTSCDLLFGNE